MLRFAQDKRSACPRLCQTNTTPAFKIQELEYRVVMRIFGLKLVGDETRFFYLWMQTQ